MIDSLDSFEICDGCPTEAAVDLSDLTRTGCTLSGTIVAAFCDQQYTTVVIDYGDGQSETIEADQLNGTEVDHAYSAAGLYNFTVTLQRNGINCTYGRSITTTCGGGSGEGDQSGGCSLWTFWDCFDWSWCGLAALIAALMVMAAILVFAYVPTVTPAAVSVAALFALALALLWPECPPCLSEIAAIIGALAAIVVITVALVAGAPPVNWMYALIVAVLLIHIGYTIINEDRCVHGGGPARPLFEEVEYGG